LVPPPVLCCSPTLAGQRSPFYCGVLLVSTSCLLSGSVWIIQEAFDIRDEIASDVLWKHYGTDNVWEIMTKQSLVLFIHVNDLHNGGVLLSEKDRMISNALLQKLVEEH